MIDWMTLIGSLRVYRMGMPKIGMLGVALLGFANKIVRVRVRG